MNHMVYTIIAQVCEYVSLRLMYYCIFQFFDFQGLKLPSLTQYISAKNNDTDLPSAQKMFVLGPSLTYLSFNIFFSDRF